jgi:hypothetical protein
VCLKPEPEYQVTGDTGANSYMLWAQAVGMRILTVSDKIKGRKVRCWAQVV